MDDRSRELHLAAVVEKEPDVAVRGGVDPTKTEQFPDTRERLAKFRLSRPPKTLAEALYPHLVKE